MKLNGRTILITGGTSGIGLELARQLLARGNTVVVTGRDELKLEAARHELPGVHALRSDVSDPGAIAVLRDHVLDRFPMLDVLVNNAGIARKLDLKVERDLLDVTREIDVNLCGPVRMVQAFLAHFKAQNEALIINVSSPVAYVPFPAMPVYCAAKAALHSYSQSLRAQLDGTNVTLVELVPPTIHRPPVRSEGDALTKSRKVMAVHVFAGETIAGIEAGKLEIRPGFSNILKIMSRVVPQFTFRQMVKASKLRPY